MNDDDLQALFARHGDLAPAAEPVAARIEQGYQRRRRRRIVWRGAGIAAAVAVAVAAPTVAIGAAGTRPRPAPAATASLPSLPSGPLNLLIAGVDTLPGQKPADLSRADTIIVVHVPATRDRAYLVSIPRDADVSIPASGRYPGGKDTINAAFAFGGVDLLRRTIQANFGVAVDGSLVADFAGFEQVLKLLGGVDMCVDELTVSLHIGTTATGAFAAPFRVDPNGIPHPVPGVRPIVYQPGCQHLAPWQALDYARQRVSLPGGDIDRERHTRQLLTALVKQVETSGILNDPGRTDALLRAVRAAVHVDTGGLAPLALIGMLGALDYRSLLGVQVPGSYEFSSGRTMLMVGAEGRDLLTALTRDDLNGWIAAHPGVVSG